MDDLLITIREKGKNMLSSLLPQEIVSPVIKYKPLKALPGEWRERDINRWLKAEFLSGRNGQSWLRFIRYISVEFEEKNQVRLIVMTNAFVRLYIDAQLSDLWHDYRTSSVMLTVKSMTLLGLPLLPQFLSRWLTNLCMSIAGFLFNPISLNKGALIRFNADKIHLDFHSYFQECAHSAVQLYLRDIDGKIKNNFVIFGAETCRGGIKPKIHKLSAEAQQRCRYRAKSWIAKNNKVWFRMNDIWQLALVAGVAFFTVLFVRSHVFLDIPPFSFSWSFFISLLILFISMGLINLARWIYQFYWQSKRRSIVFRAEEIQYRIQRIARDVELEMDRFRGNANNVDLESDLLRAGHHRFKVKMFQQRIEEFSREIKVKYIIAYIITLFTEFAAFHYF